jgi:hypothetical protein
MPEPLRSRTLGTFTATGPNPRLDFPLWQVAVSHHRRPTLQRLRTLELLQEFTEPRDTSCVRTPGHERTRFGTLRDPWQDDSGPTAMGAEWLYDVDGGTGGHGSARPCRWRPSPGTWAWAMSTCGGCSSTMWAQPAPRRTTPRCAPWAWTRPPPGVDSTPSPWSMTLRANAWPRLRGPRPEHRGGLRRRPQGARRRPAGHRASVHRHVRAYLAGVAKHLPQAMVGFDAFHVIQLANEAVDAVRRQEVKTEPALRGTR